jgi:hypothetical protein
MMAKRIGYVTVFSTKVLLLATDCSRRMTEGAIDGCSEGGSVGAVDGNRVGISVVGFTVGDSVGIMEGTSVGAIDGNMLGILVVVGDIDWEGTMEGLCDGVIVGDAVGGAVGNVVGDRVGVIEVGNALGAEELIGAWVGSGVGEVVCTVGS